MEKRVQINTAEPKAYKALGELMKYVKTCDLDPVHTELINIRASQINGCAFCLDMHTRDALKQGEKDQRIFVLSAWRETDFFSEEEQVILRMTEEITLISQQGLSSETYQKAAALFDEHYISKIIMAIVTINTLNRIAISTHKPIVS